MDRFSFYEKSDISGWTLLSRNGRIEVWHYYSDRHAGSFSSWSEACDWAMANSTIPRLPKKCWPSGYEEDWHELVALARKVS